MVIGITCYPVAGGSGVVATELGQLVGVKYAEAYTIREHILIDDPLNMPVSSV